MGKMKTFINPDDASDSDINQHFFSSESEFTSLWWKLNKQLTLHLVTSHNIDWLVGWLYVAKALQRNLNPNFPLMIPISPSG